MRLNFALKTSVYLGQIEVSQLEAPAQCGSGAAADDLTALAEVLLGVSIEGKYFRMRRDLCVGEAVVTSRGRLGVGVRRMVSLSGYQHYTSPPAKSRFSVMQRDVLCCVLDAESACCDKIVIEVILELGRVPLTFRRTSLRSPGRLAACRAPPA
ncbi:hypothetical protein EVAR_30814_1 [Eumeta japonica]|uniref:Uncharacterized protein n=1 Tax=Eumeta variegata TaxID=151549 RepID=A0A4C2AAU4_EUMVA|nr:hypothetical protein EVAR_30814_1 [Eumeta japonica]